MTRIFKGHNGWEAKDHVELFGNKVLVVNTYKGSNGLVTHLMANTLSDGMLCWEMFGDYSQRVQHKERCTEKAVTNLHACVMANIGTFITEAKAHYAAKELKAA